MKRAPDDVTARMREIERQGGGRVRCADSSWTAIRKPRPGLRKPGGGRWQRLPFALLMAAAEAPGRGAVSASCGLTIASMACPPEPGGRIWLLPPAGHEEALGVSLERDGSWSAALVSCRPGMPVQRQEGLDAGQAHLLAAAFAGRHPGVPRARTPGMPPPDLVTGEVPLSEELRLCAEPGPPSGALAQAGPVVLRGRPGIPLRAGVAGVPAANVQAFTAGELAHPRLEAVPARRHRTRAADGVRPHSPYRSAPAGRLPASGRGVRPPWGL